MVRAVDADRASVLAECAAKVRMAHWVKTTPVVWGRPKAANVLGLQEAIPMNGSSQWTQTATVS